MATQPSDATIALEVLRSGHTGNDAVVLTAGRIQSYEGGAYYLYTGRAIAAIAAVGSTVEKKKLQGNVGQTLTVVSDQASQLSAQADRFKKVLEKSLWIRIGVGALGILLLLGAFELRLAKDVA